ncbi:hypothetical protein [Nocardioides daphniae]|uniref:Uncharacterized protein n=1 Tax=Nocardioides daphniae TaxID=402297 RepID=A0A4V1CWT7_9ACTN|nr:hypothetical protein [Nocardioides daphniae]QCC78407.1 hypothetical protein E2C04_16575 [Nocardioides daphniae]GGD12715.1 hypothetical protein GCM10007231_09660 [Nocardioides daphniae]
MSHDHDHEEAVLSIAAQMIADESAEHVATVSHESPGLHLELVDLSEGAPEDDEWDFDLPADLGLKILLGGVDPEVAVQLLRAAADYLEEAIEEGDDEDEDDD